MLSRVHTPAASPAATGAPPPQCPAPAQSRAAPVPARAGAPARQSRRRPGTQPPARAQLPAPVASCPRRPALSASAVAHPHAAAELPARRFRLRGQLSRSSLQAASTKQYALLKRDEKRSSLPLLAMKKAHTRVILSVAKNLVFTVLISWLPEILRCAQNDMPESYFYGYLSKDEKKGASLKSRCSLRGFQREHQRDHLADLVDRWLYSSGTSSISSEDGTPNAFASFARVLMDISR